MAHAETVGDMEAQSDPTFQSSELLAQASERLSSEIEEFEKLEARALSLLLELALWLIEPIQSGIRLGTPCRAHRRPAEERWPGTAWSKGGWRV